ncbi:MAG: undecaprenyl/decaprenyl-phosphate alpha-N-acetylglucosaminyl 1-phosphate transferase [Candidatus Magasanikbacteria bacterium]|nr:undecaprenyl/decaprenyl-phosphate alpha-N-acetylglucosaminyl 1-phosphate transferase [Candidatus Magasanikbacteria bacterium]
MYLAYFLLTFTLSLLTTFGIILLMRRFDIVDKAKTATRKIHKKPIPLGGGLAIFVSTCVMVLIVLSSGGSFSHDIVPRNLLGLFIGGLILMIGGIIDDKYTLRAKHQIIFPILATLSIIGFGIGPHLVSSPFGGTFDLSQWQIHVDGLGTLVVFADMLVFLWLMGMMFTTKFLDGLDGLVSGIVGIGALVIFFLSLQPEWYQPDVAMLAIIFAGAIFGFLVWNFHPAKIFLGEGGSLFTGFMLGVLAIVSGGKIATTLLVVAIPMLDVARVVIRRIQKKKPIYIGDSEHLHFRLLASGLSQRQAVVLLYTISLLFGVSALFLQSKQKLIALIFLFVLMLLIGIWFSRKDSSNL